MLAIPSGYVHNGGQNGDVESGVTCCDSSFREQFGGYLCFSAYHYSDVLLTSSSFINSQPLKNKMSSRSLKQHAHFQF